MLLDLAQLQEMHPKLPGDLALLLVTRAGLGLQRNGHRPGVGVPLDLERALSRGSLAWPLADMSKIDQHDRDRVTEDGAEAVALATVHRTRGWRVVRRMQRRHHADWLLEHSDEGRNLRVALEVSGVGRGGIASRLREKLEQVANSPDVDQRWAGVVGFEEPAVALHSTGGDRGR